MDLLTKNKEIDVKSRIKALAVALTLTSPAAAVADGNVIGTGVFHDAVGVLNIYYQHKLSDSGAVVLGYGSVNAIDLGGSFGTLTASAIGVSYKGYFSDYANGGYYQVGGSSINISSSTAGAASGIGIIAVLGYEAKLGKNFIMGGEVGLGTANGFGLIGVNAGYMF
jgi:hypothetical protein